MHEKGWHDKEQRVRDRVEELRNQGGVGVVFLAPIHGAGAPREMGGQHVGRGRRRPVVGVNLPNLVESCSDLS